MRWLIGLLIYKVVYRVLYRFNKILIFDFYVLANRAYSLLKALNNFDISSPT